MSPHRRRGIDTATWVLVTATTRRLAAQTTEAARIRDIAHLVARRYQNIGLEQRAGHLFEVMHERSFNLDAIAKDAAVRARTTEWVAGQGQNAAADLHLVDGETLVGAAQAKLLGRASTAARSIANNRYDGMQRLLAGDKLTAVEGLLDKALKRSPEGIYQTDYADARAHVTDTLRHGDVRSAPVTTAQAHTAAQDAGAWGDRQFLHTAGRDVAGAAAAGAAVGGLLAGAIEAATQAARVRGGETSAAAAAASAAGAAARNAIRSGAVAGLGATLRAAATAGTLPTALGQGSIAITTADAVVTITEAGLAHARGDIDAAELAARCCETALRATLVGVCGAVGQTVIPVPVVGGLVGGLVGQSAATLIARGLRQALTRSDDLDDRALAVLQDEVDAAIASATLFSEAERALGEEFDAYATATVGPLLDDALLAVVTDDLDEGLQRLTEAAGQFAGTPLFVTIAEFDAWMDDPTSSLTLDPNWR